VNLDFPSSDEDTEMKNKYFTGTEESFGMKPPKVDRVVFVEVRLIINSILNFLGILKNNPKFFTSFK
jgi:hypothetical protein